MKNARRFLPLFLVLCMLTGMLPAHAEDDVKKLLDLDVEYGLTDSAIPDGQNEANQLNLLMLVVKNVCDESMDRSAPAKDITLTLEGTNGLQFSQVKNGVISYINEAGENDAMVTDPVKVPDSSSSLLTISVGDLAYGESKTFFFVLTFTDPTYDTVSMHARAVTKKGDYVDYRCNFDVGTDAYAVVISSATDGRFSYIFPKSHAQALEMYENSYYNGRKVQVLAELLETEDLWGDLDRSLADALIDENDILYVYVSAHGFVPSEDGTPSGAFAVYNDRDEEEGRKVTYAEIYEYFAALTEGTVVFLFDCCYSGQAVNIANSENRDPYHFAVLTSTNTFYESPIGNFGSSFSNALYGAMNNHKADPGKNGIVSLAELHAYVRKEGDKPALNITGVYMAPELYGKTLQPLFMWDEDARYYSKPLSPENEKWDWYVADPNVASIVVAIRPDIVSEDTHYSFVPEIIVYAMNDQGVVNDAISDKITQDLLAIYMKAGDLAAEAPVMYEESGGQYGKGYYELKLKSAAAVPCVSLHLTFSEWNNLSVWARGESYEYTFSYDLLSGERLDGQQAPVDELTVEEMLDPDNPSARAQLIDLIAEDLSEYDITMDAREAAACLIDGEKGSWTLNEDGFRGIFDVWEITMSRSDGTPLTEISYEELNGILNTEYNTSIPSFEATGGAHFVVNAGGDGTLPTGVSPYGYVSGFGIQAGKNINNLTVTACPIGQNSYSAFLVGYASNLVNGVIYLPVLDNHEYTASWTDRQGDHTATMTIENGRFIIGAGN